MDVGKGPLPIHFAENVSVEAPEFKLIHPQEPIVLLGTDILVWRVGKQVFQYVGIHPVTH